MILIQEVLISSAVVEEKFVCNLNACKGACCWEGDWGAPLEKEERQKLEEIYEDIKPYLRTEGIAAIEKKGLFTYFDPPKEYGTSLLDNGACAYLTLDNGIAKCGIEKAWEEGVSDWRKPISCHLYPVRVSKNKNTGFEALNYDEWDICSAACSLGKELQVPVYQFVKDALIRKYGEQFYEELDGTATYLRGKKSTD